VPLEQWLIILRVHSSEIENWVVLWAGGNSRNSRVTGDDDKVRWRKLYRQCGASRICAVNKKYSTLRAASNPKKAGRPSKSEVLVQENQGKWENQGAGGGGKGRVNCLITAASCRGKQRRRCQEQRENPRRTAPFVAASSPKRVENILSTFLINLNALSCLSLHLAPQSLKDPHSSPRFGTSALWSWCEGSASRTGVLPASRTARMLRMLRSQKVLEPGPSPTPIRLDDADELCSSPEKVTFT